MSRALPAIHWKSSIKALRPAEQSSVPVKRAPRQSSTRKTDVPYKSKSRRNASAFLCGGVGASALHDLRQQLIGMHPIRMFVKVAGENQLVRLSLLDQHFK